MPRNKDIQIAIIATDLLDFQHRVKTVYWNGKGSFHGNRAYVTGNVTLFAVLYDARTVRGREIQAVDVTPKARETRTDLTEMLTECYQRLTESGLRALNAAYGR